jgi:hypothetical protein
MFKGVESQFNKVAYYEQALVLNNQQLNNALCGKASGDKVTELLTQRAYIKDLLIEALRNEVEVIKARFSARAA